MKVEVVYEDKKDKELIELVKFSAPFFVEFIDVQTKNGKKEGYQIKSEFGTKLNPFIVLYDDEDEFIKCFWSEDGNARQQFINCYNNND